jgi:hypothetical protein
VGVSDGGAVTDHQRALLLHLGINPERLEALALEVEGAGDEIGVTRAETLFLLVDLLIAALAVLPVDLEDGARDAIARSIKQGRLAPWLMFVAGYGIAPFERGR